MHIKVFVAVAAIAISAFALAGRSPAWAERTIYSFCKKGGTCPDGLGPDAPLLADSAGNLYGVTFDGGSGGSGVVFRLMPGGRKFAFKVLHRFDDTDGATPTGNLIIDTGGNLYGMTPIGGTSGKGVVFELLPNADRSKYEIVTLYDFCARTSCTDGAYPFGGLTYAGQETGAPYDGASPLFGTASEGGASNAGVALELIGEPGQSGRKEKVIYNFCSQANCSDGATSGSGLVVDASGNLFGDTEAGGNAQNAGVIFELSPQGKAFAQSVLYSFCPLKKCKDGAEPRAALAMDAQGDLFGTTEFGGAFTGADCAEFSFPGCGTVFELRGSRYTVLHSFCADYPACTDGYMPLADVASDAKGDLFGVTVSGGSGGGGTAFKLHGTNYTLLYSFCTRPGCADGSGPDAGVILGPSGDLFGTTYGGGTGGIVFELKP